MITKMYASYSENLDEMDYSLKDKLPRLLSREVDHLNSPINLK